MTDTDRSPIAYLYWPCANPSDTKEVTPETLPDLGFNATDLAAIRSMPFGDMRKFQLHETDYYVYRAR